MNNWHDSMRANQNRPFTLVTFVRHTGPRGLKKSKDSTIFQLISAKVLALHCRTPNSLSAMKKLQQEDRPVSKFKWQLPGIDVLEDENDSRAADIQQKYEKEGKN